MQLLFNVNQQKDLRKKLRKNLTPPEQKFWSKIRSRQAGYKFRRQYGIGNFIVDFCCPELKLIIEIDGDSHTEKAQAEKDKFRKDYLEKLGFKIIRYNNRDVLYNIEGVCEDLLRHLPHPTSPWKGEGYEQL